MHTRVFLGPLCCQVSSDPPACVSLPIWKTLIFKGGLNFLCVVDWTGGSLYHITLWVQLNYLQNRTGALPEMLAEMLAEMLPEMLAEMLVTNGGQYDAVCGRVKGSHHTVPSESIPTP
jgi:hypothetical protein